MSPAADVPPAAGDEITVLYDDGVYSAIWGRFRRPPFQQIGVRWNQGDTPGGNGYSRKKKSLIVAEGTATVKLGLSGPERGGLICRCTSAINDNSSV